MILTKIDLSQAGADGTQAADNPVKIETLNNKAKELICRDVDSCSAKNWDTGRVNDIFEKIAGRACEFKLLKEAPKPEATPDKTPTDDTANKQQEANADAQSTAPTVQTNAQ